MLLFLVIFYNTMIIRKNVVLISGLNAYIYSIYSIDGSLSNMSGVWEDPKAWIVETITS